MSRQSIDTRGICADPADHHQAWGRSASKVFSHKAVKYSELTGKQITPKDEVKGIPQKRKVIFILI